MMQTYVQTAGRNLHSTEDKYVHVDIVLTIIMIVTILYIVCSTNAVVVWLLCVITAQSTSYPFPIQHPNLKESVISALMSSQLNAIMKVRMVVVYFKLLHSYL